MKKATIAKLLVVCLIASLLCIPAGAAASEPTWVKGEGSTYSMSLTKDGTVDTSKLANATYTVNAGVYKLSVSGTVLSGVTLKATYGSAKTELFTVKGEAALTNLAAQNDGDEVYTISGSVTLKAGAEFKYLKSLKGTVTVTAAENATLSEPTTEAGYTIYKATTQGGGGGGEGGNGGGGSSGGSSGTTTPSEPKDTEVAVKPTVDKDKGTASATMSNSDANKMVNDAAKNKSENVIVTVDPKDENVTEVSATIPASAVKNLAEKTNANLVVATPVANITLPTEALKELGGASGTVTVTATQVDENTVKIAVAKNNDEPMTSISGGLTARVPLTEEKNKPGTVAILVMPDGTEKVIKKSVNKDGELIVPLDGSATIKYVDNAQTDKFTDEIPDYTKDAVDFVTSRGLFLGVTTETFGASDKMNRAMIVTVLHRLEDTPVGGTPEFGDVNSGDWFAEAVAWANSNDIVKGYGDSFGANDPVTREQIATFLYRYANMMKMDTTGRGSLDGFGDGANTSDWAKDAMEWAVSINLFQGDGGASTLRPGETATRGEVAILLMRFVEKMAG